MKYTMKDSDISRSIDFNWAAMSLITMLCSYMSLIFVSLIDDNLVFRMLVKALSEDANCPSIASNRLLTLSCSLIEPRILVIFCHHKHHAEAIESLWTLIKCNFNLIANSNWTWCFIFPHNASNIHPTYLKKNSLLPYIMIITIKIENIIFSIRDTYRLYNCIKLKNNMLLKILDCYIHKSPM